MEQETTIKAEDIPNSEEAPLYLPGKTSVRLMAELADMCLAVIAGAFLYFGFAAAFGYNSLTSELVEITNAQLTEQNSAHLLIQKGDGTTYTKDQYLAEEVTSVYNRTDQGEATVSDRLYLYYTTYELRFAEENAAKARPVYSPASFNVKILGLPATLTEENKSALFAYDSKAADPLNTIGILNDKTYENLKDYRVNGVRTAEALAANTDLTSWARTTFDNAIQEFRLSEPYYGNVLKYAQLINRRAYTATGASLASYLTSGLIFFLVVPLIKLKGTTLGKKILKLDVRGKDGAPLHVWQILSRGVVEILEYVFEIPLQAILTLGFDTFALPLFVVGGTSVQLFVFAIAGILVTLVSMLLVIFHKNHQSFHDMASLTYVYTSDYAIIDAERAKRKAVRGDDNE